MAGLKKLKIAMIAPVFGQEGGPEVVCKNLTDSLLKKGIDVTLFAPGDWKTKAKHIHTLPISLWKMKDFKKQTEAVRENLIFSSQLEILNYQKSFDIIHFHSQRRASVVAKLLKKPCVLTLHNRISPKEFEQIRQAKINAVALSAGRRKRMKTSAIIGNGIPVGEIKYSFEKGSYLISIGRIIEQKGIDIAIKIAKNAKKKLLIIGRIGDSPERQKYFQLEIKPYLNDNIILKEQMPQRDAFRYIQKAEALLFPIRGGLSLIPLLVMESLACGTPVIGTIIRPMPKALNNSNVGYLSNNFNDLVKAAKNTDRFDRKACRECAEKYFDISIMAEKYIWLYKKIIAKNKRK